MRGKHPTQSEWRTLRRVAISGQEDQVRRLLQEMRQSYPDDAEVAEELARLENGEALRVVESKGQRTERLIEEAQQGITDMLERCVRSQDLSRSHTIDLQDMERRLRSHIRTLRREGKPAPQGTRALARLLSKELKKRKKKNTRLCMVRLVIAGLVALLLALILLVLRSRAGELAHRLRDAQNAADWNKTTELLRAADTGINQLIHRDVTAAVADARKWQQRVQTASNEMMRQMLAYENLKVVSSLSLEERASVLRRIRALPMPFSTRLLGKWEEQCRPVRQIFEKQKSEAMARFGQSFPMPDLTGEPAQDEQTLQQAERQLTTILHDFRDAQDALELDQDLIVPYRDTFARVSGMLRDIDQLTRAGKLLSTARSYAEHLKALEDLKPMNYPTAIRIAKILPALGSQEEMLYARMRSMKYRVPAALPAPYPSYIMKAVTEAGPTFGSQFPASAVQLGLMEDLFTSRALRTRLYELISPDGQVNYTEERPEVTKDNKLRFRVSELDPRFQPAKERKECLYAQAVRIRVVDVSGLMATTQIERSTFFLRANVPEILGRITRVHAAACPALAKAYVYDTLLRLMEGQENQPVYGLKFSPMLREDILSFRNLKRKLGVKLRINAWLEPTEEYMRAEAAFSKWFRERCDRHYEREMSENLRTILLDRPRYAGYTDEASHPCYKTLRKPAAHRKLYYISDGHLIVTPASEPMHRPDPFSPIFIDD